MKSKRHMELDMLKAKVRAIHPDLDVTECEIPGYYYISLPGAQTRNVVVGFYRLRELEMYLLGAMNGLKLSQSLVRMYESEKGVIRVSMDDGKYSASLYPNERQPTEIKSGCPKIEEIEEAVRQFDPQMRVI